MSAPSHSKLCSIGEHDPGHSYPLSDTSLCYYITWYRSASQWSLYWGISLAQHIREMKPLLQNIFQNSSKSRSSCLHSCCNLAGERLEQYRMRQLRWYSMRKSQTIFFLIPNLRQWHSAHIWIYLVIWEEKEMATHSSVLAWRIPETGEPGGLLSMGSHRVRHNWSDLAAAAAAVIWEYIHSPNIYSRELGIRNLDLSMQMRKYIMGSRHWHGETSLVSFLEFSTLNLTSLSRRISSCSQLFREILGLASFFFLISKFGN